MPTAGNLELLCKSLYINFQIFFLEVPILVAELVSIQIIYITHSHAVADCISL